MSNQQFCFMCGMENCNCEKIFERVRGSWSKGMEIDSKAVSASETLSPATEYVGEQPMHPNNRLFTAMVAAMQSVIADKCWSGATAPAIAIRARELAKALVKEYEAVVKK